MKYQDRLTKIVKKECEEKSINGVINWLFDKEVVNIVGVKRFVVYSDYIENLKITRENNNITIGEIVSKLSRRHNISKRYVQYICNKYSEL